MAQSVSLVDANPINHLSAIFGYHMEEVVDHPCFWAVRMNLKVKGSVHVHRNRLDASATL